MIEADRPLGGLLHVQLFNQTSDHSIPVRVLMTSLRQTIPGSQLASAKARFWYQNQLLEEFPPGALRTMDKTAMAIANSTRRIRTLTKLLLVGTSLALTAQAALSDGIGEVDNSIIPAEIADNAVLLR